MFIVFGTARSGTTLLSTTLSQHSEIVVPRETDFIVPLLLIADRVRKEEIGKRLLADLIVASRSYGATLYAHGVRRVDVEEAIADAEYTPSALLTAIYAKLAEKAGKSLAGDKSPDDIACLAPFFESRVLESEGISVVHIVRDVRDVVLSLLNVEWGGRRAAEAAPLLWNAYNLMLQVASEHFPNYLLVRYEDMVARPRETFECVTDLLGVPFEESMLDHDGRGREWLHMPYHANLAKPIETDRVRLWERQLDPALLDLCERQALEGLETFGYVTGPSRRGRSKAILRLTT